MDSFTKTFVNDDAQKTIKILEGRVSDLRSEIRVMKKNEKRAENVLKDNPYFEKAKQLEKELEEERKKRDSIISERQKQFNKHASSYLQKLKSEREQGMALKRKIGWLTNNNKSLRSRVGLLEEERDELRSKLNENNPGFGNQVFKEQAEIDKAIIDNLNGQVKLLTEINLLLSRQAPSTSTTTVATIDKPEIFLGSQNSSNPTNSGEVDDYSDSLFDRELSPEYLPHPLTQPGQSSVPSNSGEADDYSGSLFDMEMSPEYIPHPVTKPGPSSQYHCPSPVNYQSPTRVETSAENVQEEGAHPQSGPNCEEPRPSTSAEAFAREKIDELTGAKGNVFIKRDESAPDRYIVAFSVSKTIKINKREKFKCGHCSLPFKHETSLTRHIGIKHGVVPVEIKCQRCPYTTDRNDSMLRHCRLVHKLDTAFYCAECSKHYEYEGAYISHLKKLHPNSDRFKSKSRKK